MHGLAFLCFKNALHIPVHVYMFIYSDMSAIKIRGSLDEPHVLLRVGMIGKIKIYMVSVIFRLSKENTEMAIIQRVVNGLALTTLLYQPSIF
ncbi:MAG: hypothetical protein NVSMB49_29350 [Ktedonobacteraceae bacterium]